jgi:hypothetical protein
MGGHGLQVEEPTGAPERFLACREAPGDARGAAKQFTAQLITQAFLQELNL